LSMAATGYSPGPAPANDARLTGDQMVTYYTEHA
jgi:hypothetical protein